jgi:hypothetical protein
MKTGCSELRSWEPGSAMVPTFCEKFDWPSRLQAGCSGNASDGDLPLAGGEGGGLPNNESLSLIVAPNL